MSTADKLTAALLRERLAGTKLALDPTNVMLPPAIERWPDDMQKALTASLKPAGVLIPVIEHQLGLTVLLTRRAAELKHHASQISFPGGRMEDGDVDIVATALRETHEEVGIAPADVSVLGYLEPMPTVTGYAVTPIVGLVAPPAELTVDTTEVELAFEVPLSFLLDSSNAIPAERDFLGQKVPIVEFRYDEHRIWGATAHMLIVLREKIL
ncbi:MAG: CoA pyrophosphatase [Gammaproteobacteria bacterium]|nr:CoA pyrophosphatase [Gammaproteobacteria bacterium]